MGLRFSHSTFKVHVTCHIRIGIARHARSIWVRGDTTRAVAEVRTIGIRLVSEDKEIIVARINIRRNRDLCGISIEFSRIKSLEIIYLSQSPVMGIIPTDIRIVDEPDVILPIEARRRIAFAVILHRPFHCQSLSDTRIGAGDTGHMQVGEFVGINGHHLTALADTLVPSHHLPIEDGTGHVTGNIIVVHHRLCQSREGRSGGLAFRSTPEVEVVRGGMIQRRPAEIGAVLINNIIIGREHAAEVRQGIQLVRIACRLEIGGNGEDAHHIFPTDSPHLGRIVAVERQSCELVGRVADGG